MTGATLEAAAKAPPNRSMSWGEDLVTVLCGLWLMGGIAIDGWAHRNLPQIETFFTPWHAVFYSGFTATAAWILWSARRRRVVGRPLVEAIPQGYELGVAGVVLFALGGVGDMIWHTFLGIEVDIDALMSPTHLVLFLGVILIVTSPLRAAWQRPGAAPGVRDFLPVMLSAALAAGFTSFMFLYLSPFLDIDMSYRAGLNEGGYQRFLQQRGGIASILVTTVILYSVILLLVSRWRTPPGTFTLILAIAATLVQAVGNFENPWLIAVAALGGLGGDLLARFLRPGTGSPGRFRIFAAAAPALLWSLYVIAAGVRYGLGWQVELWGGAVIWSGIVGLGLSLLILTPKKPGGLEA